MMYLLLIAFGILSAYAEDAVLKRFNEGNTQFTASVYKEMLKSNSGNFLVCPLSVDIILALVHSGAEGQTAKQLSAGLYLPETKEEIHEIFNKLKTSLKGNKDYDLSSANKVYVKDGFKISDNFKSVAVNVFDAEIQNIEFSKKEVAATEMNKWVEDKTHDRIKNLIKPDDLDDNTAAVLINAMYFHGAWEKQFSSYATAPKPFHINAKSSVDIDMMRLTDGFNYYESAELNAKFLEMPYKGGDVSMTFVLPNEIEGLSALEANMEKVLAAPKYTHERVDVTIPKFTIDTSIQFKPILQALGVKDAFEDSADFSGIGANKEPLKISKVIQKAFIEVEEKGTTAAAATAVIFLPGSPLPRPPFRAFIADHPFVFCIKVQNMVAFIGRFNGRVA